MRIGQRKAIDLTGERFGKWVAVRRVENFPNKVAGWWCRCDCGAERAVRGSDLRWGKSTNCGCVRRQSVGNIQRSRPPHETSSWKGDAVEYVSAHSRVRALRGAVQSHACIDCGSPAEEWSYRGGCPNERVSVSDKPGLRYSPDPEMYDPRCRVCHCEFDGRNARRDERGRFARRG